MHYLKLNPLTVPSPSSKGMEGCWQHGSTSEDRPGADWRLQKPALEQGAGESCPHQGKKAQDRMAWSSNQKVGVRKVAVMHSWGHGGFLNSQSWFQDFTWQFYSITLQFAQQLLASFAESKRIRIDYLISPFVWHPSRCSFIAQQAQGHIRSWAPPSYANTPSWRKGEKNSSR